MEILVLILFCGLVVFVVNSSLKRHELNRAERYRQHHQRRHQYREPSYRRQRELYQEFHYPSYRQDSISTWIAVAVIIIIFSLFMMGGRKEIHVKKEITPSNITSMVITRKLN